MTHELRTRSYTLISEMRLVTTLALLACAAVPAAAFTVPSCVSLRAKHAPGAVGGAARAVSLHPTAARNVYAKTV